MQKAPLVRRQPAFTEQRRSDGPGAPEHRVGVDRVVVARVRSHVYLSATFVGSVHLVDGRRRPEGRAPFPEQPGRVGAHALRKPRQDLPRPLHNRQREVRRPSGPGEPSRDVEGHLHPGCPAPYDRQAERLRRGVEHLVQLRTEGTDAIDRLGAHRGVGQGRIHPPDVDRQHVVGDGVPLSRRDRAGLRIEGRGAGRHVRGPRLPGHLLQVHADVVDRVHPAQVLRHHARVVEPALGINEGYLDPRVGPFPGMGEAGQHGVSPSDEDEMQRLGHRTAIHQERKAANAHTRLGAVVAYKTSISCAARVASRAPRGGTQGTFRRNSLGETPRPRRPGRAPWCR